MKGYIGIIGAAFLGGMMSVGAMRFLDDDGKGASDIIMNNTESGMVHATTLNENENLPVVSSYVDLTAAAEATVEEVVYVKVTQEGQAVVQYDPFDYFFNGNKEGRRYKMPDKQGSGSGVVIRQDGYIVTNNHVVNGADKIEVIFNNNESYTAKVVGLDPSTDLALLKIDATDLKAIPIGNSDDLKLGEWVLAVGNPYNLNSTVTAGIVSAKARNINILQGSKGTPPLEAFIQTDAAVNPGNSGGALVNGRGELIGINSAIKSPTGSYSGYSFAIPVNIMKKVVNDIMEYGIVQRAFIGVSIQNVNAKLAVEENLQTKSGIYVADVADLGAAKAAGIEKGDVLVGVNSVEVSSVAELQSQISLYNPGDEVAVNVNRNGDIKTFNLQLRNSSGTMEEVKMADKSLAALGANFSEIDEEMKEKLDLSAGIMIDELRNGKFAKSGIKNGFIVTHIDHEPVTSMEQFTEMLKSKNGGTLLSGMYPNGHKKHYGVGL